MAAQYHSIDLVRLGLTPGEGRRLDLEVEPGALELGGQRYEPSPPAVPARLEISRTAAGHAFRLSFEATLTGPCVRCLEPARLTVAVDAREVEMSGSGDEELTSPYVDRDVLDVGAWSRDALALAVPPQVLCRPDCAGLCAVCGASLNDAPAGAHEHGGGRDPRWAKLGELLE